MIQSLPIEYRPQDLAAYGLTPLSATRQVRDAIFGLTVAEVNDGVRRYGLGPAAPEDGRDEVEDLREARAARGWAARSCGWRRWRTSGPEMASNLIARENSQRKAVVSLNVAEGANLGHLVAEVQRIGSTRSSQRHGYTGEVRRPVRGPAVGQPRDPGVQAEASCS